MFERTPGTALSTYDPAGRFEWTQSTMGKQENEHKKKNDGKKYSTDTISCALKIKKKPTKENLKAANWQ